MHFIPSATVGKELFQNHLPGLLRDSSWLGSILCSPEINDSEARCRQGTLNRRTRKWSGLYEDVTHVGGILDEIGLVETKEERVYFFCFPG